MARIFYLTLLLVFPTLVAVGQDRASQAELVRGGSSVNEQPVEDLDFSFRKDDFRSDVKEESRFEIDTNVQPAAAELPIPTPDSSPSLKLAARSSERKPSEKSSLGKPLDSLITVAGSLCIVLTIFFGLAWLMRRGTPKNLGKLPSEVIELLGKAPLVKGQEMQLVRIGSKLLLLCVTPTSCETLTEIEEEEEVARLSTICRRNNPAGVTVAFNEMLSSMGREPARGFTGTARSTPQRGGRNG